MFNLAFNNKAIKLSEKGNQRIGRRGFLKWISSILLVPLGYGWAVTVSRQQKKDELKEILVSPGIAQGLSFQGPLIISRNQSSVRFFSAKCPHLGCKISKIENDKLVCPCHGSTFSKEGRILKGPADSSLKEYSYAIDENSGEYIIKVES